MDDIVLLHRTGAQGAKPFAEQVLVWKTCLRQIAFVPTGDVARLRGEQDEVFEGPGAFAFLLEVICGLRSPIVGETEVFGQFKIFVASLSEATDAINAINAKDANLVSSGSSLQASHEFQLRAFFQALIQAAKALRSEHLVGLGSQGYGSLVRKLSKADCSVSLLGSGQLVREILPWLVKEKKTQVLYRNHTRALEISQTHPSVQTVSLKDPEMKVYSCLIVAAPLEDAELLQWLLARPGQVRKILDLRGELQDPSLFQDFQFISLKDVFANIEKNKAELETKVQQLKELVLARAQEHYERILYRPFGWEDLCV
jgi:glutamyl-tRNA reductase